MLDWRNFSLAVVCVVASSARADQCAWVEDAVAQKAAPMIRESGTVVEWCQPCGEAKPSAPQSVHSVEIHAVENGKYRALSVNGKDEDLA
jgi:hypothetical protein